MGTVGGPRVRITCRRAGCPPRCHRRQTTARDPDAPAEQPWETGSATPKRSASPGPVPGCHADQRRTAGRSAGFRTWVLLEVREWAKASHSYSTPIILLKECTSSIKKLPLFPSFLRMLAVFYRSYPRALSRLRTPSSSLLVTTSRMQNVTRSVTESKPVSSTIFCRRL